MDEGPTPDLVETALELERGMLSHGAKGEDALEGEAHVAKDGRVVRTQRDGHAMVHEHGKRVHRHGGCQALKFTSVARTRM